MSSRSVSNGQTVKQGTQLGFMGNTLPIIRTTFTLRTSSGRMECRQDKRS